MKKTLLAVAAIGAFASAAQAQSSVTVYGIYDGGYNNLAMKDTSASNVIVNSQAASLLGSSSASSRFGIRGNEQIDGDLSAIFNLELGITASTGEIGTTTASNTANATGANQGQETGVRTSTVGLASKNFGSFVVGRQTTGIHDIVAGNVWGGNNMVGDIMYSDVRAGALGAVNTVSGRVSSLATRSSGMATYTSPTIAGANVRLDWGTTELTGGAASKTPVATATTNLPGVQYAIKGATASYTWGPIIAKVGTTTVKSNEALLVSEAFASSQTTINAANISYSGVKDLLVQYSFGTNRTDNAAGVIQSGLRAQKLSASYKIGAFMPFVQYGVGNTQGTRAISAANTSTEDKALQVGTEYMLSKRTNLYAAYGDQERKVVGSTAKSQWTQIAAGVKHTF